MAMKKLSALQSLLKHKFALLVAASAVTALFVVFAALPIIKFSGLSFVSSNLLKPNTAKANLSYDDGCSNAFWQWWISGSDEDYAVAEAMCSGGGGGGGVDSGGGGGCGGGEEGGVVVVSSFRAAASSAACARSMARAPSRPRRRIQITRPKPKAKRSTRTPHQRITR